MYLLQVFQRRVDGSVDFYQNWYKYEHGFGDLAHEHWLGMLYNCDVKIKHKCHKSQKGLPLETKNTQNH